MPPEVRRIHDALNDVSFNLFRAAEHLMESDVERPGYYIAGAIAQLKKIGKSLDKAKRSRTRRRSHLGR